MNKRMHDLIWQVCNVALEHGTHSDIDAAADVQAWLNGQPEQPEPDDIPLDDIKQCMRYAIEAGGIIGATAFLNVAHWLGSLTEPSDGRAE